MSMLVAFDGITINFTGDSKEEMENSIKTFCLLWERVGGDRGKIPLCSRQMQEIESASKSVIEACSGFPGMAGGKVWEVFGSPRTKTYDAIYDERDGKFVQNDVIKILTVNGESPKPVMERAKESSADKGTVHLDSSMSVGEFTAAIKKGGMKTVDLDDFENIRELTRKAKGERSASSGR